MEKCKIITATVSHCQRVNANATAKSKQRVKLICFEMWQFPNRSDITVHTQHTHTHMRTNTHTHPYQLFPEAPLATLRI